MNKHNFLKVQGESACCGCAMCEEICPKNAIKMREDPEGFVYPRIQDNICIECGLCQHRCPIINENTKVDGTFEQQGYIAQCTDKALLYNSASGGVFAVLAKDVLSSRGVVIGCAMELDDAEINVEHMVITSVEDLWKLQGSKYVQSDTRRIYSACKKELDAGRKVLFSGTPCQVAALSNYLGTAKYPNLITMDIICHGVPSVRFFRDYLRCLERLKRCRISKFLFRDKKYGWSLEGSVEYTDKKAKKRKERITAQQSLYYRMFLSADSYRDSCYNCKFANLNRPSDFTVGDFWGVETEYPESLSENGGFMCPEFGVSCLLTNTEKGELYLLRLKGELQLKKVKIDNITKYNMQLRNPSEKGACRDRLIQIYSKYGYCVACFWYALKLIGRKIKRFCRKQRKG